MKYSSRGQKGDRFHDYSKRKKTIISQYNNDGYDVSSIYGNCVGVLLANFSMDKNMRRTLRKAI